MKNFVKHDLIMTIIILFCLITVFCLGDYYERRGIIIAVIATYILLQIQKRDISQI